VAITAIGSPVGANSGSSSVNTVTVNLSVTAGDRIIAIGGAYGQTHVGATISDDVNGAYTIDKSHTRISGIVIASVVATTTATVTITFDAASNAPLTICAQAFRSIHATYADTSSTGDDLSSGPADTAGITTTDADVVIAATVLGTASNFTISVPSGHTSIYALENTSGAAQMRVTYKIQTAAGAEDPQMTLSGGTWWAMAVMSYKPAAGATGNPYYYYAQQ